MLPLTKLKAVSSFGRRLFSSETRFPPGLRLIENFLPAANENIIRSKSLELAQKIDTSMKQPSQSVKTTTYLSKQHNLTTDDAYYKIRIADGEGKFLDAQHFAKYGDHGHSLTYFIGNSNVPLYVRSFLISSLEKLQPPLMEQPLSTSGTTRATAWRFSFNIYRAIDSQRAGFPWHIDTHSNGVATAIYTLLSEGQMELKRPEDSSATYKIILPPNSLLILSGEARWKWQHRVLSEGRTNDVNEGQSTASTADEAPVKRLSLVLGCQ